MYECIERQLEDEIEMCPRENMRCESLQLRVQTCQLQLFSLLVWVALVKNSCLRHVLWTVLKFITKKGFYEKSKDFMKMEMEKRKRKNRSEH